MMGAVNYVTTIVKMRAPGLTMMRLPLTIWALFIAALLQLFALPGADRGEHHAAARPTSLHTGFFTPSNLVINNMTPDAITSLAGGGQAAGGQPLLWQHLFWFYSHPAVYIMVVPAMGFASDLLSVHSRKPIFGYKPMVYSMMAIAGLGFIVWGHHMFTSGMNPALGMTFMVSTIMIALPSAIKVFNWLGTLWGSRLQITTPLLFAVGFVSMFIIGGLSGIWMAATPVDIYIHDTYIVVAHFHYVVFAGSVFAIFGAIYHWFPKMFGRMMNEKLGKLHFIGTFIFTNCVFYMMHQLGVAGLMRRTADPYAYERLRAPPAAQPVHLHQRLLPLRLAGAVRVQLLPQPVLGQARRAATPGARASLEWEAPSPPGHGNFDHRLEVYPRPLRVRHARGHGRRPAPGAARLSVPQRPAPAMSDPIRASTSAWPRRLALWTLCAAVPLVLFGGTVTTMHAGHGGERLAGAGRLLPLAVPARHAPARRGHVRRAPPPRAGLAGRLAVDRAGRGHAGQATGVRPRG